MSKKLFADIKTDSATGGGPAQKRKVDPIYLRVRDLIRPAIEGMTNCYDFDFDSTHENIEILPSCSTQGTNDMQVTEEFEMLETIVTEVPENIYDPLNTTQNIEQTNNWSEYTPEKLRTPVSQTLNNRSQSNRRRPVSNVQKDSDGNKVHKAKVLATMELLNEYAIEELGMQRELFKLRKSIDEEKLKQECIRTEIMQMELEKLKRL